LHVFRSQAGLKDDLFVRELANNPKADSMNIWPLHGYGRKTARHWLGLKRVAWKDGTAAEFGIERKSGGELLGLVGLDSIDAAGVKLSCRFCCKKGNSVETSFRPQSNSEPFQRASAAPNAATTALVIRTRKAFNSPSPRCQGFKDED
jgi:hypothetical protein